ncbi:MAG: 5'/3'-nucleotidase SurE [Bacteriovoracaceae bacterium]|jgi:5'-nucleotidase|nr:5'/3'-nucleotidase SurE [Bacteriovoracaceae bacterium]
MKPKKTMKILICNDDGVYAPGIKALKAELMKIGDVTVVAPLEERSTTGHTLTLDHPLRIVEIEKNVFGCSGYPADCGLLGLAEVMKDNKPDLVVSGINRGANLAQDIYYSGTVAAAREASFHNIKAISVSTVIDFGASKGSEERYETAARFVKELILTKIHESLPKYAMLNVNVPNVIDKDIVGIKASAIGFRHYSEEILKRTDFKKREYYWIGGIYKGFENIPGSDCNAVEEGNISVTPIQIIGQAQQDLKFWQSKLDQINF